MVKLASYFVDNEQNLLADPKSILKGKKYRFSILTPRLIRIEYNENGIFEDRATSLVINRKFQGTQFDLKFDETTITITTEYLSLKYLKDSPITNKNIIVKVNGTDKEWTP